MCAWLGDYEFQFQRENYQNCCKVSVLAVFETIFISICSILSKESGRSGWNITDRMLNLPFDYEITK